MPRLTRYIPYLPLVLEQIGLSKQCGPRSDATKCGVLLRPQCFLYPVFSKKSEGTWYSAFCGVWAWCVSYNFRLILLKLYRCFNHGLKICMCFLRIFVIFFFHFFHIFNRHFCMVPSLYWEPCKRNSSYSSIPILLKLHRYLNHGLKICMCFLQNLKIIFFKFFTFLS